MQRKSTDNTINNNPPLTTSSQNNDTPNSKKSSEKNIPINHPKSNDQPKPVDLTKDNITQEMPQNVNSKSLSDVNVKDKAISSENPKTQSTQNSVTEKQSSIREHKTITKVTSPDSDNQPEKQSRSTDSIKRDRALFFK